MKKKNRSQKTNTKHKIKKECEWTDWYVMCVFWKTEKEIVFLSTMLNQIDSNRYTSQV